MARRQKYVAIVDLRELRAAADAAQRRLIASRIREMELEYGDLSLGTVMIVNSAFENEYGFSGLMMRAVGLLMPGTFRKQSLLHMQDFKLFAEQGKDVRDTA